MSRLPSERFGAVIRQLRKSRGWSQERLAADASLNRSYMGEIERAHAIPTLATAEKLAQALEVALSELISRCEAPATPGRAAVSLEQVD
jgi:XRE family transcriptional regulator, regulator of sulfur utilization